MAFLLGKARLGMSCREMPDAERQTPSSEVGQAHANERISAGVTGLLPNL